MRARQPYEQSVRGALAWGALLAIASATACATGGSYGSESDADPGGSGDDGSAVDAPNDGPISDHGGREAPSGDETWIDDTGGGDMGQDASGDAEDSGDGDDGSGDASVESGPGLEAGADAAPMDSSTLPPCAMAYSESECTSYQQGTVISAGGHNWLCSDANCANCGATSTCAPGASGCAWGVVWTDQGACH